MTQGPLPVLGSQVPVVPAWRRPWLSVQARRGLVLPVLLLVLWEMSARLGWIDVRFLPPLGQIATTAWREVMEGGLLYHLSASLTRNLTGFVIGTLAGMALGAWLGLSRLARKLVFPTFHAAKQIAVLAWIPLISIWFGFAETAKVAFIVLAAFVPVVLNTYEGVTSAPRQIIEVSRVLCLTRWQVLRRVYLPVATPAILNGVHLALIYAWLATVAAEYFMTVGPGLGGMIIAGRERFEMDIVMLGVVVLGIVGYGLNLLAQAVETYLLRWRDG